MVVSPGALTFTIFGFHCLLYVLFRRLGYQKPPKNWGIVYDKDNKKPLGRAIARIYDKQFNKLLETRVTDGKGRYSFLVNNNVYYVTAERLGYKKAKTADIDLVSKDKEAVVGMDIALEKGVGEAVTPPSVSAPSVPPTPPVTPVAKIEATPKPRPTLPQAPQPVRSVKVGEQDIAGRLSELAVSRESLEELVKAKQAAQELKQEIDQRVEQLEEFEEKFEEIKEGIDKKLEKLGPDTKAETGQEPGETQPSQPPKPAVKEPTPPTKPTPPKTSSELLDDKEENPADKKEPPTGKSIFG